MRETASEKDVVAQWGPSGSWPRSIPVDLEPATVRGSDQAAGLFPQTMSVMGNRWGFALLVAAFVGISRFTDFQTQLGAPPGSIADRLSIFTANGVFETSDNRYRLTEKGRALFPVLVTALQWAQRWYHAPEGPAVVLTHTACGRRFSAVLACDQCAGPLRGARVHPRGEHELVPDIPAETRTEIQFEPPKLAEKLLALSRAGVLISQVHSDLVARRRWRALSDIGGGLLCFVLILSVTLTR